MYIGTQHIQDAITDLLKYCLIWLDSWRKVVHLQYDVYTESFLTETTLKEGTSNS